MLAGHDWGGSVAILNAAHPRKLSEGLHHPGQLRKSWYFYFFALPEVPEAVVHANNWHFFRHFLHDANPAIHPIKAPTLVIWGQRDAYLGQELAEPDHDDVPGLERVERLPDASHWVHHDDAERVNELIIDFFAPTHRGP